MRIGLIEMKNFCQEFFEDVKTETFLEESAGVADLITSCELENWLSDVADFQVLEDGIGSVQRLLSRKRRWDIRSFCSDWNSDCCAHSHLISWSRICSGDKVSQFKFKVSR
jgi:hypothetical protein